MNPGTFLVALVVLLIVASIVFGMRRDKKNRKSSCGGSCGACGACGMKAEITAGLNDEAQITRLMNLETMEDSFVALREKE